MENYIVWSEIGSVSEERGRHTPTKNSQEYPPVRTFPCVNLKMSRFAGECIYILCLGSRFSADSFAKKNPFQLGAEKGKERCGTFFFVRKCEKRCRIKELAWFDIRRQSQPRWRSTKKEFEGIRSKLISLD